LEFAGFGILTVIDNLTSPGNKESFFTRWDGQLPGRPSDINEWSHGIGVGTHVGRPMDTNSILCHFELSFGFIQVHTVGVMDIHHNSLNTHASSEENARVEIGVSKQIGAGSPSSQWNLAVS